MEKKIKKEIILNLMPEIKSWLRIFKASEFRQSIEFDCVESKKTGSNLQLNNTSILRAAHFLSDFHFCPLFCWNSYSLEPTC